MRLYSQPRLKELCNIEEGINRELYIIRRGRLRERDSPNTKWRTREPTSFWRENVVVIVNLLRVLARIS